MVNYTSPLRGLRRSVVLGSLTVLGMAGALVGAPAAHAEMVAVDLGVLSGACCSEALAINSAGWVVGYRGTRAVAWRPDHTIVRLPGLRGETESEIVDVNYGSYGVGWSVVGGHYKAVQWPDLIGGGFALAPSYNGDTQALGINDNYEVFGVARPIGQSSWYPVKFVYPDVVRITSPTTYVEPTMGISNTPNNTIAVGQTNGCPNSCDKNQWAYEYGIGAPGSAGTMSLPSLAGAASMRAAAASADGTRITGSSMAPNGYTEHAALWTLGQTSRGYPAWNLQDLGAPPTSDGSARSAAGRGISPDGSIVVGRAAASIGQNEGFYWTARTGPQALPRLAVHPPCYFDEANDVTSSGVIVGMSCAGTGFLHAVEWTTVPPR
jgi:uncharacterized membrane protein